MTCTACGTENEAGRKFCSQCGAKLAVTCAACGAANGPIDRFCGECGAALAGQAQPKEATTKSLQAERRLVSVLFADLVGHTALSETRDAEDVRELLTRYFDVSRTVIERYGGTVEKFIGDAVMAVWGAPSAHDDDAERAVRAGLDLVGAVSALGADVGIAELGARAGVLTGEAAVTLGAEGQGMVAGDLVNTASRIQSAADPGAVLVGEPTKRATEAAIVYEDAGTHELKGKAEPVPLWQATRVVALRGGAVKSAVLEPPFVGRDRELRLVKELFHASAEDRRAHLVSVTGIGGIGKSRLVWELEKYIDGLAVRVWWHRGRCLAYGEGVAFWALAEMVRGRAGIVEDENPESALAKLRASLGEHIPDSKERRFVEPRLGHLLGLVDRPAGDHENLFAAWRMLFERLAEKQPVVLVFEDIHWADNALLDFVEYLVDWSKDLPMFVVTLARPELADRRPTWGAGKRSFSSLYLEPLPPDAMDELLTGPAPGLPDELRERILERAEGVPFYAVETVRMLLDRGLLTREGDAYLPVGPIETLEVPETLQALIAARLDGLQPEERRLLQHGCVLGRTFTLRGLQAMTGLAEGELQPLLASLIRKEVLSQTVDPLSPERGQYGFLQDLVKKVAYDTISRRERKVLHLAAAAHLRSLGEDEEIVEVVASHYLDAYHAAPTDPDAAETKAEALTMLVRAGERAASLGANAEAQAHFEGAAELAEDTLTQAGLLERSGTVAEAGGRPDAAIPYYERAIAILEGQGQTHAAARVLARLGRAMWRIGRVEESVRMMDTSFQVVSREEADEDLASLAAELGRALYFSGQTETAAERIEVALEIAEGLWIPGVLSEALNTKALILLAKGRQHEALALLEYALRIALDNDIPSAALRTFNNAAELNLQFDRFRDAHDYVRSGLALARRVGNRTMEWMVLSQNYPLFALGEWDELLANAGQLPEERAAEQRNAFNCYRNIVPQVHAQRGELERARSVFDLVAATGITEDVQERATHATGQAGLLLIEGRPAEALAVVEEALGAREAVGTGHEAFREGFIVAVEAALQLGETTRADKLLRAVEQLPRGKVPPYLHAHCSRFRARLAEATGESNLVESGFKRAAATFRELSVPFWIAVTLLEHGEWLAAQGRAAEAEPLLAEARELFERLRATPWLERLDRVAAPAPAHSL